MKALIKKHKLYHNIRGFSMAEMMMAVAIIGVLAAVSFISVSSYMRSMTLLERNGIAKEIFVAAQNHLTYADSQDYPGIDDKDFEYLKSLKVDGWSDADGKSIISYLICVNKGDEFSKNKLLNLMLPFGAIDETVRLGGDYIIHFSMEPARILNVFYSESNGSRYDIDNINAYADIIKRLIVSGNKKEDPASDAVIGYFGEDEAKTLESVKVRPPKVEVINGDKLKVVIEDPNDKKLSVSIRLIVEGVQSGNIRKDIYIKKYIKKSEPDGPDGNASFTFIDEEPSEAGYTYIMDDVTTPRKHFYQLFGTGVDPLWPGEDIKISAEAWSVSSDSFSNIAVSAEYITNSLYARVIDPDDPDDLDDYQKLAVDDKNYDDAYPILDGKKIIISSFRHLENLDQDVSCVNKDSTVFDEDKSACAFQTKNLDWDTFSTAVKSSTIYTSSGDNPSHGFYPVCPIANMSYNGAYSYYANEDGDDKEELHREYHKILNVVIDAKSGYAGGEEGAGLFGKLTGEDEENKYFIKNLELVDFKVNSEKNHVGALAGYAENAIIDNVIVYNSSADNNAMIKTTNGSAGGLIGEMKGGKIARCGAALAVEGSVNAGGLIGTVKDSEIIIKDCYSGGQTDEGVYGESSPNVKGGVVAGGLIGSATGSYEISNSYSTCSVEGSTAGGFIGTGIGKCESCYATGLVNNGASDTDKGKTSGAFSGSTGGTYTDCFYLETINGSFIENDYVYLDPLGGTDPDDKVVGLKPYDSDEVNDYSFDSTGMSQSGSSVEEQIAVPYDISLNSAFNTANGSVYYPLKRYGDMLDEDDANVITYVKIHHGDWPMPEVLVINDKDISAETG